MNNVVKKIAEDRIVETIIGNVARNSNDEDLKDLANDIYLELLEKDEDWLLGIYERGQINYYITRIVTNNINSKTSRYFYTYKKDKLKQITIDEYKEKAD